MLETVATVLLLGVMAAFAVCAVLFNEGEGVHRRRRRQGRVAPPAALRVVTPGEIAVGGAPPASDRRLPAAEFLFGALFLRGPEPLAFSALADAAEGSGMSIRQVLAWIDQAEAGGLIERVGEDETGKPALRLTEAGIYVACIDRRRTGRARAVRPPDGARVAGS